MNDLDTAICRHCGQEIVRSRPGSMFWMLVGEDIHRVAACPDSVSLYTGQKGIAHEPEDDDV